MAPVVAAIEACVARLRRAAGESQELTVAACGVLDGGPHHVVLGIECERSDGSLPGLALSFRFQAMPPGEGYRGILGGNVQWHRPPAAGRRERTVFEARSREIRFTGPPPVAALLEQLPQLEQAMQAAMKRGRPPGATTRVFLVESEAGWGRRIDEEVEFATREEAERYAREHNESSHPGPVSSEWSIVAKVERLDGTSVLG